MILKVETITNGRSTKKNKTVRLSAVLSQASQDGEDSHAVFESGVFLENEILCKGFFLPETNKGTLTPEMQTILDGMETIDLPNSLNELLPNTFDGCQSLITVDLSNIIDTIPEACFRNCTSLEKISIPRSISEIGPSAFENCSELNSLQIPEGISVIPYKCFKDCTSLQVVNIPSTMRVLGACAFQNCAKLRKMSLPDGLEIIYEDCFSNCEKLVQVSIPNSVQVIDARAFSNCPALKEIKIPGGVRRLGQMSVEGTYSSSGGSVFKNCVSLSKVTLDEGIDSMTGSDFFNCQALEEIDLPSSLGYLGSFAFENCVNLKVINIPESTTSIPEGCFTSCYSLEEIMIPQSVKSIGRGAFANCSKLKNITLPETISEIEWNAFQGCSSLSKISIPNNVEAIQSDCFQGCTHLQKVHLPNSLTKIWSNAFADCHELENLHLPESVSEIGQKAFSECFSLEQVTIPENVKAVGDDAFLNCAHLKSVTIPRWMEQIASRIFTGKCHPTEIKFHENEKNFVKDGLLISKDRGEIISCLEEVSPELTIPMEVRVIKANAFKIGKVKNIVIFHPILLEPNALSGVSHLQILDSAFTSFPPAGDFIDFPKLIEIIDNNGIILGRFRREYKLFSSPEEYDDQKINKVAHSSPDVNYKIEIAIERLQYPFGLSESARKDYKTNISKHRKQTINLLFENNRLEDLYIIADICITRYNIDDVLELADKKKKYPSGRLPNEL